MGTLRRSILVSCLLLAGSATDAMAGDFLFPQTPIAPIPQPIAIPDTSNGWYFRGDIAWGHQENPDVSQSGTTFNNIDIDNTWTFGAGFGHNFSDSLRGDLTLDYRLDSEVSAIDPATGQKHTTELSTTVALANMYYDIGGRDEFTPYVGAGLGFAYNDTSEREIAGVPSTGGHGEFDLAAAAMAGFSYRLGDEGWMLNAGYRFLYLGDAETDSSTGTGALDMDDLFAHEVRLGVRYEFR